MGFEPMPLSRMAPKATALTTRPNLLGPKKKAPAGIEPAIYCLRSSCLNHLAIEPDIKKGGDAGIEPTTSCTLSKNHTPRPITQDEI